VRVDFRVRLFSDRKRTRMFLTSLAIQNARPKQKPYKLADGDGLHLLVQPNGKKLWRLRYRFADKENMLALGSLPAV
jgi:hypothetical protein